MQGRSWLTGGVIAVAMLSVPGRSERSAPTRRPDDPARRRLHELSARSAIAGRGDGLAPLSRRQLAAAYGVEVLWRVLAGYLVAHHARPTGP